MIYSRTSSRIGILSEHLFFKINLKQAYSVEVLFLLFSFRYVSLLYRIHCCIREGMDRMYYEEHEHIAYHFDNSDAYRLQPTAPMSSPPASPPPKPMSSAQAGTFAVDPGAIRRCMFRFTYIWMRSGNAFWFWPVFVGRTSVSGFRWTGRGWVYTGISLNSIDMFTC